MTFKLKIENSRILKGIVETLASIIDETEFRVSPKEFIITAMDPSRICLLKLSLKSDDFDNYECKQDIKIGLNLDDLDKILKRSSTNDSIEIEFKENDNKIKIIMKREGSSRSRTFSLALLDIEMEEIQMEKLLQIEYKSKWVIDPNFFVEAIKDAEIYSEILNIKAEEKKGLTFSSSGQIGEMIYDLTEEDLIESNIKDSSTGAYSLTFLKAILKISSITEKLEISLLTDHPLKMIFNLLEGGELSYFLAPRVEEADFNDEDMDEF
ncbi:MAG: proliferating cell nuclear antigen (pcna) [Candidatus Lokiarchaeota archaeon]|nr:proliferating cell nuclear antigen (pcna) [Candidatus Lokiarchaeota archaeon]